MTERKVAFLGLGAMGLPMALNLQRKGFAVTGWNRTIARGEPLLAAGGGLADSVRAAVADADYVVTMLADPPAVAAVALGPDGFVQACRPGTVWLECSTIGPTAAQQLAEAAEFYGLHFVDGPVLGSVKPATDGTLHFVAGGSPEALELARPLMEAMGTQITHLGPAGAGAAAKVISNTVTATLLAVVGEGLALGERLGLDRSQLATLLANGPAGGPIVKGKAPLMVSEQFTPAFFQLKLMEKDMGLCLTEAHGVGAAMPAASGAHAAFAGARAAGYGDQDFAAVAGFARKVAQGPFSKV